ncbi:MAG: hypothetical protein Q9159_000989 [Coniocarpon cinnabarinum]
MAETGDLIDFDVIEDSKENIQALPSGRSAKSLASVFSPLAIKSPSHTQDINDLARQDFEKEIQNIEDSDDPLDVYDRYCKWTLNTYPAAQATPQSQLLPLLERATRAFLDSPHYKNDPRYMRLWLSYIRFFSDDPRETFAYLARRGIGDGLALYYEEFAAWLENAGRWSQAEEVFNMGIENEARPVERLMRKFGEFEKRLETQPRAAQQPGSPALPAVRPALASRADPFAQSDPQAPDAQAQQSQRQASSAMGRGKKLEIFSDEGAESRPLSSGSRGWENIGTVADRKKENVVGASVWTGETMKSSRAPSTAPKMMVFKDPSLSRVPLPPVESHPSLDQKVVNPRTGKLECVAVNLEAVYPDPANPDVEFCFEELRAAKRGWLQKNWRSVASPKRNWTPSKPPRLPLTNSPQKQLRGGADNDTAVASREYTPRIVRLNDENDENAPPRLASPSMKATVSKKKGMNDENKTRKIKVREMRNETQTIQTNLNSPQGPRIRRKKSSDPTATVTICTKAARDEMYDLFNQTLDANDTTEVIDDGLSSDDDYTSAGDSTGGTGHISTTTSDFEDDHTDADLVEVASAPDTEETGNNTGWTDFDTRKDLPDHGHNGQNDTDDVEASPEEGSDMSENAGDAVLDEEVKTPNSPELLVETKRTFTIPLPPDDIEAPTRPYRDPEQVAQSRLPFMTPIAEQTESSMGTGLTYKEKDYFNIKTPCPKGGQRTPVIPEDEGELLSSPFQEELEEALNNRHPIPQPKLDPAPQRSVVPLSPAISNTPAPKISKDATMKGPIVRDRQCNPTNESIRQTILMEMHPPLSSFKGFFDHGLQMSNRRTDIRRYCKATAKGGKSLNEKTCTVTLPPILTFDGAERQLAVQRELGAGAFAPVYLAEPIDEESEEVADVTGSANGARRRLEAVKMEDPPSSWEFYIIRAAKRRLGVSRAADSIIDAYEMHLFQDEGFLVEEYRDQGTLLDLINVCTREHAAAGNSGAMDETLAMFFTVELFRTVEGLHGKGIIHGDLKPDNVMIRFEDPTNVSSCEELSANYDRSGAGGWSAKGISLIDFGRGIDMRAFQPNVQFIADWETSATDCAEMRELRPWTFQADYHGLAAIVHVMLFGKYIDTIADRGGALGAGATKTYRLRESLKRYWQTEIWQEVFAFLLNSGRAAECEEGGRLPALKSLKTVRERMEGWLEDNCDKGVGLKGSIKKAEASVMTRRR